MITDSDSFCLRRKVLIDRKVSLPVSLGRLQGRRLRSVEATPTYRTNRGKDRQR